jgi:hypothetical protein
MLDKQGKTVYDIALRQGSRAEKLGGLGWNRQRDESSVTPMLRREEILHRKSHSLGYEVTGYARWRGSSELDNGLLDSKL